MSSFTLTSKPVIQRLKELQTATVQVFPENVYRYKKEALNHKDVKVISHIDLHGLTIIVFDSIHNELWSLSNSTVCKVQRIPCSQTFKTVQSIAVGKIENRSKLDAIFVLDKMQGKDHSSIHVFRLGRETSYLQCLNIPKKGENFLYTRGNLIVLTEDANLICFQVTTFMKTLVQPNGKRKKSIMCEINTTSGIELSTKPSNMILLSPLSSDILLNFSNKIVVYDFEKVKIKTTINQTESVFAIASKAGELSTFYVVLNSSRKIIRTMKLNNGSSEESTESITLTEKVALLKSGLQGLLYVVTVKDQILVHSSLDLGIELWSSIQQGYVSCGYISDKTTAKQASKPTNGQAKEGIEKSCQFLEQWDARKKLALNKQTVQGKDGSVCTKDVQCISDTKRAMDINLARLEFMQCSNLNNIRIYTMFSEAHAEHGFGNMPQGTSRSLLDFATGMRNTLLNMLLRYVETNFSQPAEYRKAYFEPENDPVIDVGELTRMMSGLAPLMENSPRYFVISKHIDGPDSGSASVLREALNIARSQPRRTTRQYYKESAGYAPQTLLEQDTELLFQKDDVVAHEKVDGTIGFMAVSVNLTKEEFEKNGSVIGTVLEQTNEQFQYRCGDLTTVRSKFLLRDRLGSYLCFDASQRDSYEFYYLSETYLNDAKSAHSVT